MKFNGFIGEYSKLEVNEQELFFIQGRANTVIALAFVTGVVFGGFGIVMVVLLKWDALFSVLIGLGMLGFGFSMNQFFFNADLGVIEHTLTLKGYTLFKFKPKPQTTHEFLIDITENDDTVNLDLFDRNGFHIFQFNSLATAREFRKKVNNCSGRFRIEFSENFKESKAKRFLP